MSETEQVPHAAPSGRFELLRKLTEVSRALTYATDVEDILQLVTVRATEMLDAPSALLMLMDEEGLLQIRATQGVADEVVQRFREPFDETLPRRLQGLLGVESSDQFLGVPLVAHGAVTGLLSVVRPGADAPTEEDEWLLSALADQAAVALENAQLSRELAHAREESARSSAGEGHSEDAKDRALATLAHDLRSPLNAIDAYAELMEMEILGPIEDRQREALGRIRMSGRHLLAVLQDVLEMARLTSGVVRVETMRVDAVEIVEEAVLLVGHDAEGRGQSLRVADGEPCPVTADPDRLRQVLVNLIGNAIKYTQEGGQIEVGIGQRTAGEGAWGVVAVADDGPGIPPDKLESIFEPYVRGEDGEDEGGTGAGLGLAISRELVRRMGGEIEVASTVGRGSTFTVRLPLAAD